MAGVAETTTLARIVQNYFRQSDFSSSVTRSMSSCDFRIKTSLYDDRDTRKKILVDADAATDRLLSVSLDLSFFRCLSLLVILSLRSCYWLCYSRAKELSPRNRKNYSKKFNQLPYPYFILCPYMFGRVRAHFKVGLCHLKVNIAD